MFTWRVVKAGFLSLLTSLLLQACGGGDQPRLPGLSVAPVATVSPVSHSTLSARSNITLNFNTSMDPASLQLSGTLLSGSYNLGWSSVVHNNDRLIISPVLDWSDGSQNLIVQARSTSGLSMQQLNLQYVVDLGVGVASIFPGPGSTISGSQSIEIVFNDSMDTSSLTGSGTGWPDSDGGSWSTTTLVNDTLTINPQSSWPVGSLSLQVDADDIAGNPVPSVLLNYQVSNAYSAPLKTFCDTSEDVSYAGKNGFICTLKPSRMDPAARDVAPDPLPAFLGYGYHALAFPESGTLIKGIYIHFPGTKSQPYYVTNDTYQSKPVLLEGMAAGYIVMQIAYSNYYNINDPEECGSAAAGLIDNCAGLDRLEKITGVDSVSVIDVPLADSIEQRIKKLVEYFSASAYAFPVAIVTAGNINWANLRVGGHSQGAGHALYIGKYFGAERICMLAGAYDIRDDIGTNPIADWLLDTGTTLDLTKVRATLASDDFLYSQFVNVYDALGLVENQHWQSFFSASGYFDVYGVSSNAHMAAVTDPSYNSYRNTACFADGYFSP